MRGVVCAIHYIYRREKAANRPSAWKEKKGTTHTYHPTFFSFSIPCNNLLSWQNNNIYHGHLVRLVQLLIRDEDVVLVLHKRHDPSILFIGLSLMKKATLINHRLSHALCRSFWVILLSLFWFSSRNRDNMFAVFLYNRPRNIFFYHTAILLLFFQPQKASSFSSQVPLNNFNHKGRVCHFVSIDCALRQQ